MVERSFSADRRSLLGLAATGVALAAAVPIARAEALPLSALPPAWFESETVPLWHGAMPGGGAFVSPGLPSGLPRSAERGIARPILRVFRPRVAHGGAVLIMPGGGYAAISALSEGFEVARRMADAGFVAFVLVYRLPGEGWRDRADVPLQDAQRAMRVIRSRAHAYGVDPQRVAAIGFSAGGHLCASLATGFAEAVYAPQDDVDRQDARPMAAGLIYPVITLARPDTNGGVVDALLGASPDPALIARRSCERHVGDGTPPLFLFHAVDDAVVSMRNSVLMLEAMQTAKRPVEAHFIAVGGHGFGLGVAGQRSGLWPALFIDWLRGAGSA